MKMKEIPIKDIIKGEDAREEKLDVSSLMNSLKHNGQLQPIGVYKFGKKYKLVFGNRRRTAMTKLGWKTAFAVVFDSKEQANKKKGEWLIKNIAENVEREEITPFDLARAIDELLKKKYTYKEVAVRLSQPVAKVRELHQLLKEIPKAQRKHVTSMGKGMNRKHVGTPITTMGRIRVIADKYKLTTKQRNRLYKTAKRRNLSYHEVGTVDELLSQGYSLDQSMKNIKDYQHYAIRVFVKKSQMDKLCRKYGEKPQAVLHKILRGKIKESIKK